MPLSEEQGESSFKCEKELAEAISLIDGLFEASRDIVVQLDSRSTILRTNKRALEISGFTLEEVVGKKVGVLSFIFTPKSLALILANFAKRMLGMCIEPYEVEARSKNGEQLFFEVYAFTFRNAEGKIDGEITLLHDITKRKRLEKMLGESEEHYRNIVELLPDGAAIHCEGKIVFVNSAAQKLLGATDKGQLIGKPAISFVHPDSQMIVGERIKALLKEGTPMPMLEEKFVRLDGTPIDVETAATPTTYHGKPAVQVIVRDITLRKQAEDAIRRSEEYFRTIFNTATDGILIADLESKKFTMGNAAICRMLGYSPDEIKNIGVMDIHPGKDLLYVIDQFERQAKGEFTLAKNIPVKRKDGAVFYCDVNSTAIKMADKTYLLGVFRDITERKRAEGQILNLNEQLQTILDACPAMIFYKDKENRFIRVNEALARANGKSKQEMEGKTCWDLYPQEAADRYWQDDKDVMVAGQPKLNIIEKMKTPQGTMWVQTDKIPYRDFHGNILGIIGFTLDITQAKKQGEALHKTKDELEVIVAERTRELSDRVKELERYKLATVDREFRMKELRDEIERLKTQQGGN